MIKKLLCIQNLYEEEEISIQTSRNQGHAHNQIIKEDKIHVFEVGQAKDMAENLMRVIFGFDYYTDKIPQDIAGKN